MTQKLTFESIFNGACDRIGNTLPALISLIGEPDRSHTSESGYLFLFYDEIEVIFRTSRDKTIIECVVTPFDPDPEKLNYGYYNVLGLKVGDSVERTYQMWGQPSEIETNVLRYNTNIGRTSDGVNFEVLLNYKNGVLQDFTGLLYIVPVKPKSGCFIATACYGNYNSTEVLLLRKYRDDVLLRNKLGKKVVQLYYVLSPPIANFISRSDKLKRFIKIRILNPLIKILKLK